MEKPDLGGMFKNQRMSHPLVLLASGDDNPVNTRDARTTATPKMQRPLRERQKESSCIHSIHKVTELGRTLAIFSPEYRDALLGVEPVELAGYPARELRAQLRNLVGKIVTSCLRVNRFRSLR